MASEVGSAYFTLLPSVKGLQGAISKEVSGIDGKSAGDSIGKGMGGGIVGSLKSMVGPAIAALGVGAAFGFAKNAVASFSELEDSSAAAAVTFSGNMDRITALSLKGSTTLGLSSQQVVSSAQTFGVFGKAAGLAGEDLESFAVDMTTLSGDLSSFSGKSTEDAIAAVGSAMRGEFEPIRSFGVLLDEATLKAEAMSMGLITNTKDALTPQQKTLAAQSAILKQTSDAQGDFARTSMSTANVQKALAAETENTSAKLGSVLAPMFTAVRLKALDGVQGVSGFLDKVIAVQGVIAGGGTNQEIGKALGLSPESAQRFSDFVGPFRAFTSAYKDGSSEVTSSGFAGTLEGLGGTLGRVHAGLTMSKDEISKLGGEVDPLVGRVSSLKSGFGDLVSNLGTGAWETLKGVGASLQPVFSGLAPVFQSLGTVFQTLGPSILTLMTSFSPLGMIFKALLPVLPALASSIGLLVASLGLALSGTLSAILPMLTQLADVLVNSLGQVFTAVVPIIVSMLAQLGVYFVQLAPVIAEIIGVVVSLAVTLISQLMPIFMQLVSTVLPMVMTIFQAIVPAIIPLVQMIAGTLIPIIQALMPVVVTVFGVIASVIGSVMQIIMGIIQVVTGIISGNWAQVWQGIGNILSGVWNTIVNLVRGAISIVGSYISAGVGLAVGFMQSGFSGLVGFLGGIWSNITNGVSGMIGNVIGFFSGLIGRITGALGNAGSVLFNTGRDIIQGLINGISGMMGAIGRAVLSIVPEAIRGPFEQLLGIHSPSRVAIWWGHMIGGGLIEGLDDMVKPVSVGMEALVTAPSLSTAALAAAGGRYAYDVDSGQYRQGVTVEQTVYPSEKMSERSLADIAASKIVEELV